MQPDMPKLPVLEPDELAVLMAMSGDLAYTADQISADLAYEQPDRGWTPKLVSSLRRSLLAKGYAEFGPLWDDDGLMRGRGYWLSIAGGDIRYGRKPHAA